MSNLIGGLVSTVTGSEVWTVVLLAKSVAEIIRFRCILVIKANLKKIKKNLRTACTCYCIVKQAPNFKKSDKKKLLKKDTFNSCIVCVTTMEC